MKHFVEKILYVMARIVLWRHRPKIVAITGSVGKTTSKSASAAVLAKKFSIRENIKSYNNEIGVPLTILGVESPGRSLLGWLLLVCRWIFAVTLQRSYPDILILEMGADKPGDISYLTSLAKPTVGVLTAIAPVHLERFGSLKAIAAEKRQIIANLRPGEIAVLNADDEAVMETPVPHGVKKVTYGLAAHSSIRGSDVHWNFGSSIERHRDAGTAFKVSYDGSNVPFHVRGGVGLPLVTSALAAAAVGLSLGMNLVDISQALEELPPVPGRLRILRGLDGAVIIDDTYNSSPRAVAAALEVLRTSPVSDGGRRIAVLGDMRELGEATSAEHEHVGTLLQDAGVDILLTVGEAARLIAKSARVCGFSPDNIFSFATAEEAGRWLAEKLRRGDIVLLKGSQNYIRLEKAVKIILDNPDEGAELLVRQGKEWQT